MPNKKFLVLNLLCLACVAAPNIYAKSNYPFARMGDQVDDYHGTKVADPYRWMEDVESPETRAWIEAENNLTQNYLAKIPQREAIKKRLTQIWNYERFSVPKKIGNVYIYARNDGLQNQSVLYKSDSLSDQGTIFFDPNLLSSDGTTALNESVFSDDGSLWAYGLSVAGSDRTQWKVKEVATGKILPDSLPANRQGGVSWAKDNSGFFYSAFPPAVAGGELKENTLFQKLYFHKMGTSHSEDKVVYERPDNGEYFVGGQVSEDGKWLIVYVSKGTERTNMVYFKNISKKNSNIVPLVTELKNRYRFIGNDDAEFYFHTDKNASRGRLVKVDVSAKSPKWIDIVPEIEDTIDGIGIVNNTFIVNYMKDARSAVKIYQINGQFVRDVVLPGMGTATGFNGKRKDTETFYGFSSFNIPATVYRYDMKTGQSTVFRKAKVKFDESAFEVKQVFYNSKDGTRIPMFLVHKKGIVLDGKNPTLLYGYGGFTIAIVPSFSASIIAWLEMGGVYAVANIRGGGEYGKEWWKQGSRLKKQNVFDDFIAAAEWLINNKYSSPKKLAIEGGSNGGLLIGAVLNQRPDLFAAALPAVGVMDMLRFDKFTIGHAWKSDYGSPDDPTDFKAMYAYSPYHNAKQGTKYPATLVTTADHDDRVFPAHSFKYVAAMQRAQAGDAPILIRIETKAGHGAGKSVSKVIEETADIYSFLVSNLGMRLTNRSQP